LADLSTASTAVDMSNRILAAASRIIGKKRKNFVTDVVSRLNVTVLLIHNRINDSLGGRFGVFAPVMIDGIDDFRSLQNLAVVKFNALMHFKAHLTASGEASQLSAGSEITL
jgi:hypothetical protein